MDNGCGDGTGCFSSLRTDTTKCTNKRIAGFRKCWDLVRGEMFIKDKAKVMSRGAVYIMKRRGPRTEPCETPYEEVCEEESAAIFNTEGAWWELQWKKNQLMTMPWNWKPNQDNRRVRRMVWSYSDNSKCPITTDW